MISKGRESSLSSIKEFKTNKIKVRFQSPLNINGACFSSLYDDIIKNIQLHNYSVKN